MAAKLQESKLASDLMAMLSPKFKGMTVEVAHSKRWNRMGVTFHWAGFAGLLPEERFQRLLAVIPVNFRETRLGGFVWLELAPKESVDEYLRLPRTEDVAAAEGKIYRKLIKAGFFDALALALGPSPDKKCLADFTETMAILRDKNYSATAADEAKLALIGRGAYCDCQVLLAARQALPEAHAGAASWR